MKGPHQRNWSQQHRTIRSMPLGEPRSRPLCSLRNRMAPVRNWHAGPSSGRWSWSGRAERVMAQGTVMSSGRRRMALATTARRAAVPSYPNAD